MNYKISTTGFALILFLLAFGTLQNKTYNIAVTESVLTWTGKRMTYDHSGSIDLKTGDITFEGDHITGGQFIIDMGSIRDLDIKDEKRNSRLTNHLKSEDFFEVASYPTATFIITSAEPNLEKKGSYNIVGDLTIKGVTNTISFAALVERDDSKLKASGIITFDRTKFNVKYGSGSFFDNLGDKVIHDDIQLSVEIVGYSK